MSNLTNRTLAITLPALSISDGVQLSVDGTNRTVILGSGGQGGVVQAFSTTANFMDSA